MKGLLYNSVLQNKTYYIVALCEFLTAMVLVITIFGNYGHNNDVMSVAILIPYLSILFIPFTIFEGTGKKTERMLKCGFLKHTLTSGVSKISYAVSEAVYALASVAVSSVLCIIVFWTAGALAPEIVPPAADYIRIILLFTLFTASFMSVVNILVLFTKSEEISSLIVGCVLCILAGIAILIQEIKGEHLEIVVDNTFTITTTIVCLAVCALSAVVMKLRLERYSG